MIHAVFALSMLAALVGVQIIHRAVGKGDLAGVVPFREQEALIQSVLIWRFGIIGVALSGQVDAERRNGHTGVPCVFDNNLRFGLRTEVFFNTDEMQINAANKIERRFAKNEPFEQGEYDIQKHEPAQETQPFEPYKGKIRKSGTGGIYELNDHLFEGRYSPTNAYGKREVHTVYAKTREECERLLNEMIPKVRAEIAAEKKRLKEEQAAQE